MKVGFTGTRRGMTEKQLHWLTHTLVEIAYLNVAGRDVWFLHGDCTGADAQAHEVARGLGYRIAVFPSSRGAHRAHCEADVVMPAKHPLDRNKDIVRECCGLVACPKGPEVTRSGTWSTVRHARKTGRSVMIIWPDGRVEGEDE